MNPFELKRDENTLTVVLGGDLTAILVLALKPELQKLLGEGVVDLIFDLGAATVIDSTGIGFLVASHNSLKKMNGTMRVVQVSEDIMRLLQSMRLDKRLNVASR